MFCLKIVKGFKKRATSHHHFRQVIHLNKYQIILNRRKLSLFCHLLMFGGGGGGILTPIIIRRCLRILRL